MRRFNAFDIVAEKFLLHLRPFVFFKKFRHPVGDLLRSHHGF
jgi:hypothetical protein